MSSTAVNEVMTYPGASEVNDLRLPNTTFGILPENKDQQRMHLYPDIMNVLMRRLRLMHREHETNDEK